MARPRPRTLLVSRDLAENLVVAAGTAKAPADAGAIRMVVTLLSRAGAVVLEEDEEILQAEAARRLYDPERRFYDYLFVGLRALRLDLGRIDRKVMLGLMPRVAALQAGLRDEPGYRPGPAVMAFMSDRKGQPIDRRTVVGRVKIERTFAAAAADLVDAVPVDPRVLRRFTTRHSLVLYLRALAWLQRPPEGAKAAANGKLWFEVPYAEAQGWLGTGGIASRSNVTQNVFGPAVRELAEVGVDLTLKWKENYRGQPTHLRIGVASTPASRRQALAELSRRRAARLAERRAARPDLPALRYEARLQRYVEAGGSATMFRLRYLSRLWRRVEPRPPEDGWTPPVAAARRHRA